MARTTGKATAAARKTATRRKAVPPTAHQTTGPFFPTQYIRPQDNDLAGLGRGRRRARGEPCLITGTVRDAAGKPAVNIILEVWQADAAGRFHHPADRGTAPLDPHFTGWGRTWTDKDGGYRFVTIRPGAYPAGKGSNRWFAPRISMTILGSGLMRPLVTCLYFPDRPENAEDPQLEAIRSPALRRRLVMVPASDVEAPAGVPAFRFDITLGGRDATPFLAD